MLRQSSMSKNMVNSENEDEPEVKVKVPAVVTCIVGDRSMEELKKVHPQ